VEVKDTDPGKHTGETVLNCFWRKIGGTSSANTGPNEQLLLNSFIVSQQETENAFR